MNLKKNTLIKSLIVPYILNVEQKMTKEKRT